MDIPETPSSLGGVGGRPGRTRVNKCLAENGERSQDVRCWYIYIYKNGEDEGMRGDMRRKRGGEWFKCKLYEEREGIVKGCAGRGKHERGRR